MKVEKMKGGGNVCATRRTRGDADDQPPLRGRKFIGSTTLPF